TPGSEPYGHPCVVVVPEPDSSTVTLSLRSPPATIAGTYCESMKSSAWMRASTVDILFQASSRMSITGPGSATETGAGSRLFTAMPDFESVATWVPWTETLAVQLDTGTEAASGICALSMTRFMSSAISPWNEMSTSLRLTPLLVMSCRRAAMSLSVTPDLS